MGNQWWKSPLTIFSRKKIPMSHALYKIKYLFPTSISIAAQKLFDRSSKLLFNNMQAKITEREAPSGIKP